MRFAIRTAVMTTTATAVLLGGIAATATPASAVSSAGCTRNDRTTPCGAPTWSGRTSRTGPGVTYKDKGRLDSAGEFWVECFTVNRHGNRWYYGESLSSGSYGMKGWVAASWF